MSNGSGRRWGETLRGGWLGGSGDDAVAAEGAAAAARGGGVVYAADLEGLPSAREALARLAGAAGNASWSGS